MAGYAIIVALVCVGLAAWSLSAMSRVKNDKRHMQDPRQANIEKIRDIYARAKAKLDTLRKERRSLIERYEKKADEFRSAEAKKRLEEL